MRESVKKVKPDKTPQRGPGIAQLEKLRREESQKRFSCGTELILHPLLPQPSKTAPFLPGFDPSSPYVESFPMFQSQLLDSSPLVSSDGTMPLLWSSFQRDCSSSSNSQLSSVTSELKQPPRGPQQMSQVMNQSSLHSVSELELPSNQSSYGNVNASSWADQRMMMHQIVGMNHPWQNQRVTVPESVPIYRSNCGAMVINGTQGINTDWSIKHPSVKRNGASEEDVAASIEGSSLNLVCLPSVCCSAWSPKTMSIRQFADMNVIKRQKKTIDSAGSKASATPSEALVFYNFMELPYNDYVADRDVIANQNKRSWEGSDAVDVDLKL